jgi:hypothetical protein
MLQHGWWFLITYKNRSNNIFNTLVDEEVNLILMAGAMLKIYINGARK